MIAKVHTNRECKSARSPVDHPALRRLVPGGHRCTPAQCEMEAKTVAARATAGSGRCYGLPFVASVLLLLGVSTASARASEDSPVAVVGGADASGQLYTWTVTNRHTSKVVRVEFPHYRAVLFFAPERWSTDCTFLVNVGVEDSPGVCVAAAPTEAEGIPPGRSAEFRMQCSAAGARRGAGTVSVRFADETRSEVSGVELPCPEGVGDKYVPLIGLGAIAVILTFVSLVRRLVARRSEVSPA